MTATCYMGPLGSTQVVQGVVGGGAGTWNVREINASAIAAMGDCLISDFGVSPYVIDLPFIDASNVGGKVMIANLFGAGLPLSMVLTPAAGPGQAGLVVVGTAFGPTFDLNFIGAVVLVAVELVPAGGYFWQAESIPGPDGAPGAAGAPGAPGPPGPAGPSTGALVSVTPITALGAGVFVVPAGVASLVVEGVGGGGGSSGYSGGAGLERGAGAGGGAGGYFKQRFTGLVGGETFNYTIGAAGIAGTAVGNPSYTATPGGVGGTTTWQRAGQPATLSTALGGDGGEVMLVSGNSRIAQGGFGGQSSVGTGGLFAKQGEQGGNALRLFLAAANFFGCGGNGGSSPLGGGRSGPVQGATASASPLANNFGAGGAGGSDPGGTLPGAAGSQGAIFVEAYS